MTKSKGYRFKTRSLLRKRIRNRGILAQTYLLEDYEVGEYVDIVLEPSVQKGMPHRRYQGKTGVVIKKQGSAYIIDVRDGNAIKKIVSRPEHIRRSRSLLTQQVK